MVNALPNEMTMQSKYAAVLSLDQEQQSQVADQVIQLPVMNLH